jgi:hypothetical protein
VIKPGTVAGISRNVRRCLQRLRSRRFRERGIAPIVALAALITTVAVAGMVASAVVHAGQTISYQGQVRSAFTRSEQLEQRMSAEASSAKAIFAPATAVDGAANCSGGQCREIDFYASGATAAGNRGNFIAYLATAGGSVQRYVYTSTAGGVAHGVSADGAPIAGTQFYVREVPVTSLTSDADVTPTTKAQMVAAGVVPHRWTFQYEHYGVAASNDVFYVHFNAGAAPSSGGPGWGATATGNDLFAVSVLTKPVSSSTSFISKTFTPTTPPITSVGPTSLFFPFPGSANQGLQVHETNYHDAFTAVGACQMVGSTIASLTSTSVFPSPNIANQDSGPATFTFVPTQPGVCSQIVSDSYGTTATLPVQVAGPLVVSPTNLTMSPHASPPNGYPSNTAIVTGTKTWSYTGLTLSASNCPIVSAVQSETDAPTFSATPAGGQLTITAIATGSCTMTVSDQFGESQNVSIVVYDDPVYNLTESPATGTIGRGSSWSTATVAATVAALPAGHSYFPGTAANLNVGVIAQSYTGSAGGCAWGPTGWQAPGTSFSVTDNDPVGGVCTLTFSADTTSANNPYASLSPGSVNANITFTPQVHQQQLVCNTDGTAGTTNWSTNPPTDYVGTAASPPCVGSPPTPTPPPGPTPAPHVLVDFYCINTDGQDQDTFGNSIYESATGCAGFYADGTVALAPGYNAASLGGLTCGAGTFVTWDQNAGGPGWTTVNGSAAASSPLGYAASYYDPLVSDNVSWTAYNYMLSVMPPNLTQTDVNAGDTYCPGY